MMWAVGWKMKRKKPISRKAPIKRTGKKKGNKVSSVKAPKPKKRAPSKTTLRNKADRLCRAWFHAAEECLAEHEVIITSVPGRRLFCSGNIEWCHLVSRSVGVIRHHPLNAIPMCSAHHRYFTQRPLEFGEFIEKTFPGRSQQLKDIEREIRDAHGKPDYMFWIEWYKGRTDSFITWDGEV